MREVPLYERPTNYFQLGWNSFLIAPMHRPRMFDIFELWEWQHGYAAAYQQMTLPDWMIE